MRYRSLLPTSLRSTLAVTESLHPGHTVRQYIVFVMSVHPLVCMFMCQAVCQLLHQSFALNLFDCSYLCNHVRFSSYLVYDISTAFPLIQFSKTLGGARGQ